jgi:DNA-binding PadR family transcriptional regulator
MNDLLILALLLEGPQHGYALKKGAATIFGSGDMHNNLVYPLLRRFVQQKWVTVKKAKGERGQTRQVYSITPGGREALVNRVRDFSEAEAQSREQFSLRVGLFDVLAPADRAAILEKRKAYLDRHAAQLEVIDARMQMSGFPAQVVAFLSSATHNELTWIENLKKMAASKPAKQPRSTS